jgi:tetratricopeptide (TPR) repeat protein
MCAALARYDEAIALGLRAHELDPLTHRMELATTLLRAGKYDEALIRLEPLVELDPRRTYTGFAGVGLLPDRPGRRRNRTDRARRRYLSQYRMAWSAGRGVWSGREDRRGACGSGATRSAGGDPVRIPYHFAYVYTGLGEADRALDYLEHAVKERTGPAYGIRGSFLFAPLRPHPRFRALLAQLNLD